MDIASRVFRYPKPNTSDDYRASAQECIDRAQRVLEVAEVNLDVMVKNSNERGGLSDVDTIAHANARIQLGRAWTELALMKDAPEPAAES